MVEWAHLGITNAADARVFIRRPRPTDQGYIASTWADSITLGNVRWDKKRAARSGLNVVIDRLLDDPAVRILIASEPTKTDAILGWLCYTPLPASRVVHYVYVREKIRHRGIGAALYRKAWPEDRGKLVYTMRGPDAESLVQRYRDAIYLPVEEFLGAQ